MGLGGLDTINNEQQAMGNPTPTPDDFMELLKKYSPYIIAALILIIILQNNKQ